MKFTKMSLVTALLIGSSAFAIENTKVSGDIKLFYSSDDNFDDLFNFDDGGASGQAAASLSISTDLMEGVSAGTKVTALSSLGLEHQLVDNVWEGTNGITDSYIVNDLWVAATAGKTTTKIGRMELDTPLVFTEKWSIVENTFEAAVVINQNIPDTTIVGAYVGGSNGQLVGATPGTADTSTSTVGSANVVQGTKNESTFNQFYKGAYAIGAINNSWKPLTAQAWYFCATSTTTAYWLEADLDMEGVLLGAQYTGIGEINGVTTKSSDAFAVMAGYEMKDTSIANISKVVTKVSYSQTGKDAGAGFNLAGSGKSKLYTEAWWNYGEVTQADTTAYNVTVEAPITDILDLGLYYTSANHNAENSAGDLQEITLSATRTFGSLDTSFVLSSITRDNLNRYDQIQVYLTLNY